MRRRLAWIAGGVVVAAAVIFLWVRQDAAKDSREYRFVPVERGDLEALVSASGTLQALATVRVGTQVSGIVAKTFADFNDHVTKGEVIALIDTTLLVSAVHEGDAELDRAKADLNQKQADFDRIHSLRAANLAADTDLNAAQYNLDVAKANLKSAQINLDRARQNLDYATIRAPISGTVIERDVDVGQTVAASFSAPQLFLLADDLSHMQILASVDESDIGKIKEGQSARFSVQAYPEEKFTGIVHQVRMQSATTENVVNYTVVVNVDNPDHRLLPGMTATVDFVTGTAKDVLKVPNAALRFRPSQDMVAEMQKRRQAQAAQAPDSTKARWAEHRGQRGAAGEGAGASGEAHGGARGDGGAGGGGRNGSIPLLWYLDDQGQVAAARVQVGITDGKYTAVEGRSLKEGMQVITAITRAAAQASSSPFQSQPQGPRFGPGGF
ncbi:MAG: efflux RND transporter periplasmic adaptor subunit [bacterium]